MRGEQQTDADPLKGKMTWVPPDDNTASPSCVTFYPSVHPPPPQPTKPPNRSPRLDTNVLVYAPTRDIESWSIQLHWLW